MSVIAKLNTLFRANARSAAQTLIDANALRIYEQEIVDAEQVLARRRDAMAVLIANRNELEREIETLKALVSRREQQLRRLPEAERSDALLELAAQEIAGAESRQHRLEVQHAELTVRVKQLELTLRGMIAELQQHRRDLKQLSSQSRELHPAGGACTETLSARLQALRQTRAGIGEQLQSCRDLEAGVREMSERLDDDPLEREIDRLGVGDEVLHIAAVRERLRVSLCG